MIGIVLNADPRGSARIKQKEFIMLYGLYAVYDKTAQEYGPPFTAVNDGVARRQYKQMGIPDSLKDEYTLHLIGHYDSLAGEIVPEVVYTVEVDL